MDDGLPDEEPEPHKEWARQPRVQQVWRNDRSAAVHQPAQSKSQAKRAAKKAKVAAALKLAASDSAVESPAPDLGQSAAASAAAIPAAPELFVPAPLPEAAATVFFLESIISD